ncbi:hypothetical protein BaRGS_00007597, partial [Batillaria attramentaria]
MLPTMTCARLRAKCHVNTLHENFLTFTTALREVSVGVQKGEQRSTPPQVNCFRYTTLTAALTTPPMPQVYPPCILLLCSVSYKAFYNQPPRPVPLERLATLTNADLSFALFEEVDVELYDIAIADSRISVSAPATLEIRTRRTFLLYGGRLH